MVRTPSKREIRSFPFFHFLKKEKSHFGIFLFFRGISIIINIVINPHSPSRTNSSLFLSREKKRREEDTTMKIILSQFPVFSLEYCLHFEENKWKRRTRKKTREYIHSHGKLNNAPSSSRFLSLSLSSQFSHLSRFHDDDSCEKQDNQVHLTSNHTRTISQPMSSIFF